MKFSYPETREKTPPLPLRFAKAFRRAGRKFFKEMQYLSVPEVETTRLKYLEQLWTVQKPAPNDAIHEKAAEIALHNYRLQVEDAKAHDAKLKTGHAWSFSNPWIENLEKKGGDASIKDALYYVGRMEYSGEDEYFWADRCLYYNADLRDFVYTAHQSYNFVKKEISKDLFEKDLWSGVGQFPFVPYDHKKLDAFYLRYKYLMHRFMKKTKYRPDQKFVWCELGSGYGRAAQMFKDYFTKAKIVLIDIPGTLLAATYLLTRHFPQARIGYYQDFKDIKIISDQDLSRFDIVLLPHFMFERFAPGSLDVLWNASSLAEMPRDTVKDYFDIFDRVVKPGGVLYTSNWNRRKEYPMVYPILDEFPWNRDKWKVLSYTKIDQNLHNFRTVPIYLGELVIEHK